MKLIQLYGAEPWTLTYLEGERTSKQKRRSISTSGRTVHSRRSSSITVRLSLVRFRYTNWLFSIVNQRLSIENCMLNLVYNYHTTLTLHMF